MFFLKRRKRKKIELKRLEEFKRLEELKIFQLENKSFNEKLERSKQINNMKREVYKFQQIINEYSNRAKSAYNKNNIAEYQVHRNNLKMAMKRKKLLDTMIAQIENSQHNNKMDDSFENILKQIDSFTNQSKESFPTNNIDELYESYEEYLNKSADNNEAINVLLTSASASFEDFGNHITDEELDQRIFDIKTQNKRKTQLDSEVKQSKEKIYE